MTAKPPAPANDAGYSASVPINFGLVHTAGSAWYPTKRNPLPRYRAANAPESDAVRSVSLRSKISPCSPLAGAKEKPDVRKGGHGLGKPDGNIIFRGVWWMMGRKAILFRGNFSSALRYLFAPCATGMHIKLLIRRH